MESFDLRSALKSPVVIPAHPLALNSQRKLDERRQRALTRYYVDAGSTGVAVAVHTTQFAIRDPKHGLFRPVLEIAAEELNRAPRRLVRIGGVCGHTEQALVEAAILRDHGYDAVLLSMAAFRSESTEMMIAHVKRVAEVIPVIGFYLQPAVGGCVLSYSFWRELFELENIVGVKVAPFNRYQTIDVVRALADSGRCDIALLTGNDDNIVMDLITPFQFGEVKLRFQGGLLGQWAVGTRRARLLVERCMSGALSAELLQTAMAVTDCNAAVFDAGNGFSGCIAGIHEVLRRDGLLEGVWCLDEREGLSPGQFAEIDRVRRCYPEHFDTQFIEEHREHWLSG